MSTDQIPRSPPVIGAVQTSRATDAQAVLFETTENGAAVVLRFPNFAAAGEYLIATGAIDRTRL